MSDNNDYKKEAAWWMGKDFYNIIAAIMEQVVTAYAGNDVRECIKWVYALFVHVSPHFNKLSKEEKEELEREIMSLQDDVLSDTKGDKLASLYDFDDVEDLKENRRQIVKIMNVYMRMNELMDRHGMFMPKTDSTDYEDDGQFERNVKRLL